MMSPKLRQFILAAVLSFISLNASAVIFLRSAEDVEAFQKSLPVDQEYFTATDEIDQKLIASWKMKFPAIYSAYESLRDEEKKFITVFRGINISSNPDKINLNQRNRNYQFGPYVFTSADPSVSLIYAGKGTIFKFRIPIGLFLKNANAVEFLIENGSEAANLNAFLVGYSQKRNHAVPSGNRYDRLKAIKFYSVFSPRCEDLF